MNSLESCNESAFAQVVRFPDPAGLDRPEILDTLVTPGPPTVHDNTL